MFGSDILEVIIGLIFIFILLSTICSTIREGIEGWFKTRASFLEYGLRDLLGDKDGKGLVSAIYNHPLIHGLFSGDFKPQDGVKRARMISDGKNLPSYIPAKNFAVALMDIAARGTEYQDQEPHSANRISLDVMRQNIKNIADTRVQRALLTAIDTAEGDLTKAQANIEEWFDSSMDRVSGWYKRSTQWIIFWIALIAAAALNVNTITIADYLYRHETARALVVNRAEALTKDSNATNLNYDQAKAELDSLNLPIGWSNGWGAPVSSEQGGSGWWNLLFGPILGILLTALAAMLGAPFWFDLLNKVMVIRSTVKPHEKSPEEGSEDRRNPPKPPPAPPAVSSAPQATAVVPASRSAAFSSTAAAPMDDEKDGCGSADEHITNDEDLPETQGGVA